MSSISFVNVPIGLNNLHIRSSYELQIMALALSMPEGLRVTNGYLAEQLHVTRRTVIRAINALKDRDYLRNIGSQVMRILAPTGHAIRLLNNITTPRKLKQISYKPADAVDLVIETMEEQAEQDDCNYDDASGVVASDDSGKALWQTPEHKYSQVTGQAVSATSLVVVTGSEQVVTEIDQGVTNSGSASDRVDTHNINNTKNNKNNNIYINPFDLEVEKLARAFGGPLGKYDHDNAIRYLRTKGLDWCIEAIEEHRECVYLGECFKAAMAEDDTSGYESVYEQLKRRYG